MNNRPILGISLDRAQNEIEALVTMILEEKKFQVSRLSFATMTYRYHYVRLDTQQMVLKIGLKGDRDPSPLSLIEFTALLDLPARYRVLADLWELYLFLMKRKTHAFSQKKIKLPMGFRLCVSLGWSGALSGYRVIAQDARPADSGNFMQWLLQKVRGAR